MSCSLLVVTCWERLTSWLSSMWCLLVYLLLSHTVSWFRCDTWFIDSWSLPSSFLWPCCCLLTICYCSTVYVVCFGLVLWYSVCLISSFASITLGKKGLVALLNMYHCFHECVSLFVCILMYFTLDARGLFVISNCGIFRSYPIVNLTMCSYF